MLISKTDNIGLKEFVCAIKINLSGKKNSCRLAGKNEQKKKHHPSKICKSQRIKSTNDSSFGIKYGLSKFDTPLEL